MIRNLTIISTLIGLAAQAPQAVAQTNVQTVSGIDSDVQSLIGDAIKLTGPVTIAAPDDTLKADNLYRPGAILSVPVAFARTARLDSAVSATTGEKWGWDNDVVIPAGTMLYHATFQRLATASTPLEAWCADQSYKWGVFHDRTGHGMYCIARSKDGQAVGFYGGASNRYLGGSGYYPDKPQWFAFSLSGQHSRPFEYPKISEMELPSPPMTLSLKVEVEGGEMVNAFWALSGPTNSDPEFGVVWRPVAVMQGDRIRVILGAHTVSMDYIPATKSVTHVKIEEGVPADVEHVGLPLYYWLGYQVSAHPQQAQAVEDTPWLFGAEHVKPETLNFAGGALAKNDVLLSASAQLGMRYRLKSPLISWAHNAGAPEGAEAYQASDTHLSPDGTLYRNDYWCVKASIVECVPASLDQVPGGQGREAWQLSPSSLDIFEGINVTPYHAEYLNVGYRPLYLAEDPDPAPVTDAVQMRISEIQAGYVAVTLGLVDAGGFHAARAYTLPFDTNGDAILSLWTKRVHLHHDGKTVSVTGTDEGTGEGPQLNASHVFEVAK